MDKTDNQLIAEAVAGNSSALESLIVKHQDWIFNVALNFTGDPDEAADLKQEVLIKVITKLSTFQQKSEFKTWLYRIVKNHFLNFKRSQNSTLNFDDFGAGLDQIPDSNLKKSRFEVEEKLLVEEAKLSCMKGMLLCLAPDQRLIYILGELFEFTDTIGASIMEISKENFRIKLHRAKRQLYDFMNDKCGLINKKNPCRCARKTAGFIKMGYVDPVSLHFQKDVIARIEEMLDEKVDTLSNEIIDRYQRLYQSHPFLASPDGLSEIKKLLSSDLVKDTFVLNGSDQ